MTEDHKLPASIQRRSPRPDELSRYQCKEDQVMLKRVHFGMLIAMIWCGGALAAQLPSVEKLIEDHDANGDGKLEASEVKGASFAKQFPRWDV